MGLGCLIQPQAALSGVASSYMHQGRCDIVNPDLVFGPIRGVRVTGAYVRVLVFSGVVDYPFYLASRKEATSASVTRRARSLRLPTSSSRIIPCMCKRPTGREGVTPYVGGWWTTRAEDHRKRVSYETFRDGTPALLSHPLLAAFHVL